MKKIRLNACIQQEKLNFWRWWWFVHTKCQWKKLIFSSSMPPLLWFIMFAFTTFPSIKIDRCLLECRMHINTKSCVKERTCVYSGLLFSKRNGMENTKNSTPRDHKDQYGVIHTYETVVGEANTLFEYGAKHIFNPHETTIQKFLTSSTNMSLDSYLCFKYKAIQHPPNMW